VSHAAGTSKAEGLTVQGRLHDGATNQKAVVGNKQKLWRACKRMGLEISFSSFHNHIHNHGKRR
jgi:hypothetical protein